MNPPQKKQLWVKILFLKESYRAYNATVCMLSIKNRFSVRLEGAWFCHIYKSKDVLLW